MRVPGAGDGIPTARANPGERLYFLDWLRVFAIVVLVFYHVGLYYVTWPWMVKSPFAGPWLEPWMGVPSPWRMSLLFLISGAATAHMIRTKGASPPLLRRRSLQLLLPLSTGMALIVPPQTYFEVVAKYGYQGGYPGFLRLYFTAYHGFCRAGECTRVPTWNHLWFLPYLWLYTLVVFGLLALFPGALRALGKLAERALRPPVLLLVPMGLIVLVRWALVLRYPTTYAVLGDWYNHAMYFGMFSAGLVFASAEPCLWDRLAHIRFPALLSAIVSLVLVLRGGLGWTVTQAALGVYQWSALAAVLGFGRVHLNKDHPCRRRLTESIFPVYIVHQTIIVVGTRVLLPLRWPPVVEGPVLFFGTLALSYLVYEGARRVRVVRPWLGLLRMRAR